MEKQFMGIDQYGQTYHNLGAHPLKALCERNQCDFNHNTPNEIRRLPTGSDGAMLICHRHYTGEMRYRREMVEDGIWSKANTQFPDYADLEIVSPVMEVSQ